ATPMEVPPKMTHFGASWKPRWKTRKIVSSNAPELPYGSCGHIGWPRRRTGRASGAAGRMGPPRDAKSLGARSSHSAHNVCVPGGVLGHTSGYCGSERGGQHQQAKPNLRYAAEPPAKRTRQVIASSSEAKTPAPKSLLTHRRTL